MMYNMLSESHLSSHSHTHVQYRKCLCQYIGTNDDEDDNDNDNGKHVDHHRTTNKNLKIGGSDVGGGGDGLSSSLFASDGTLRCPACVQRTLKPHIERHEQALVDHRLAKENCARQLNSNGGSGNANGNDDDDDNNGINSNKIPHHHHRLAELQAQSQRLRDRLATLRNECSSMAVRVAAQAVENDAQREATATDSSIELHRLQLARLESNLLEGSMHHGISVATNQVRALRFQLARKSLAMHRLDIDPEDVKLTPLQQRGQQSSSASSPSAGGTSGGGNGGKTSSDKATTKTASTSTSSHPQKMMMQQRRARGIGKIGGLPLPHAGPELYGVLPPRELQSALRLVASVTCSVARCLGIILPHPILLTPTGPAGDITDTVSDADLHQHQQYEHNRRKKNEAGTQDHQLRQQQQQQRHPHQQPPPYQQQQQQQQQPSLASSTASLLSLVDGSYWKRSAQKALARATGQQKIELSTQNTFIPPSMDTEQVSKRLLHATAAVLADDESSNSSKFALSMVPTSATSVASMTTSGGGGGGAGTGSGAGTGPGVGRINQDDFAIALQLLQNDVIVLCIRAGVPVSKLWPAEAVLLNLYALDVYCEEQTAVQY